jgi:uncharacterized repeat protein (TIGR03847 family)
MKRRRRIVDLDAPDRFTVLRPDDAGRPGSDAFRLLAVKGLRRASAAIDREQLEALAGHVLVIIDELERRGLVAIEVGGWPPEEGAPEQPPGRPLGIEIRAETVAVEWDDDGDRLIVEAVSAPPGAGAGTWARPENEADPDGIPDDDPSGPDVLRVRLTPIVAQRFARLARRLAAGSP